MSFDRALILTGTFTFVGFALVFIARRFAPAPTFTPKRWLSIAATACLMWGMAAWWGMFYLAFHRPTMPNPTKGQLYPFNNHGTVVYLTRAEHLLTVDSFGYCVMVGFLLAALELKQKRDSERH